MGSNWNQTVLEWFFGLANRSFFLDSLGIFFAQYLIYFLVIGVFVYLYLERDWRKRWFIFAVAALSVILSRGIITEAIRFFYPQPRPFEVLGITSLFPENLLNSFPSGHTAFLFALGMALWFFNRRWGTCYLILAAVVGVARVFAGVHWPVDILGGAAVGIISAFLIQLLLRPYSPKEPASESENQESA